MPEKTPDTRRRRGEGRNKFPSESAIRGAFAAGVEVIEIEQPDGTKITLRKNGALRDDEDIVSKL
jgi:hypothetical protein